MNYLEIKKKAIASFANKIKGFLRNISGAPPISLESCADDTVINYKLYGNSYQATRSGKNLLDINKAINERQESTLTSGAKYYPIQLKANTSYTLSTNCYTDTLASIFINLPNVVSTTADNGVYADATYRTVTTDDTGILWIWTRVIDDGIPILDTSEFDNGTYWAQLEQGTAPTAYEQYGASPSPDYPSEVQSVGEKTKNLFDEELLLSNSNATKTDDGYRIAGYPVIYGPSSTLIKHIKSVLKPNVTYTLSRRFSGYKSTSIGSIWIRNSSTNLVQVPIGDGIKSAKFTFTQEQIDSISNIYIYGRNTSNLNGIFNYIQLEEGESPTEYEPYGKYKIPVTARSKNITNPQAWVSGVHNNGIIVNKNNYITEIGKNYIEVKLPAWAGIASEKIDITQLSVIGFKINKNQTVNEYITYYAGIDCYDKNDNKLGFKSLNTNIIADTEYRYTNLIPITNTKYIRLCILSRGQALSDIRIYDFYITKENNLTYEPYHEPITTNIYLDEPLRKVGDYADYIDFKNSMVVRKTHTIALSECSYNPQNKLLDNGFVRAGYFSPPSSVWFLGGIGLPGFCNVLPRVTSWYIQTSEGIHFGQVNAMFYIYTKSTYASKAELLNYLGEAKATYILKTPTETSISLPILPTFKGITTIYEVGTTIQPSNAEAEYYSTLKGD